MMGNKKNEAYSDTHVTTGNDNLTTIAHGAFVNGAIVVEGNLRLDGAVEGDVLCAGKMVIGPHGHVKGNVKAAELVVHGCLEGDIHTSGELILKSDCILKGNICTPRLNIEPQAAFNGVCKTFEKDIPLIELPPVEANHVLVEDDNG